MLHDIISAYSVICDLKENAKKKAQIRTLRKLPDIQYLIDCFYEIEGAG